MKLIIGLGNPGREYARSRHNFGWMVADAFAAKFRIDISRHEKEALTGSGGEAVKMLADAYLESLHDLIIAVDDVDLPLGSLRIRERGSPGTHNGMRSVADSLASERFPRLRFGVRGASYAENRRLRDYVLDEFEEEELPVVSRGIERAVDALVLFARGELRRAMNEFNRETEPDTSETS